MKAVVIIPNVTFPLYTIYTDGTVLHQPFHGWLRILKCLKQLIIEVSSPNTDVGLIIATVCVCVSAHALCLFPRFKLHLRSKKKAFRM